MTKFFSVLILVIISAFAAFAQNDTTNVDQIRTESGVDPTRVISRLAYSVWYFDQGGNRSQINNRLNFTLGINKWSFSLRPEIVTVNNGIPGEGFDTRSGDLRFSMLNAFLVKGKHSLAASAEFTLPLAPSGFGGQYFSASPALTYAYTLTPSFLVAISPQYTFDLQKDALNPELSVLTLRTFIAKFLASGWFFVFEPRVINDFQNDQLELIVSPIIGKSLGAGFNLTSLFEFPIERNTRNNRGVLIQIGLTKNF